MKTNFFLFAIILISTLLLSISEVKAQNIVGALSVSEGQTETYNYTCTLSATRTKWIVNGAGGAQIIQENSETSVLVQWGTSGLGDIGIYEWKYHALLGAFGWVEVEKINVNVLAAVAAPPNPIVVSSNNCGNKIIRKVGAPSSGKSWYWRKELIVPASELFDFPALQDLTITQSGAYYIFAYEASTNRWSNGYGSINIDVSHLNPGVIGGSQIICDDQNLSSLTNTIAASDNNEPIQYLWKWRDDINSTWLEAPGTNNELNYAPGEFIGSRQYVRTVSNAICGELRSNILTITVNETPQSDAGYALTHYQFEGNIILSGTGETPQSGTFSGINVSNNEFNAASANTGTFEISYTYDNGNCTNTDTKEITVLSNPIISLDGTNDIVWGDQRNMSAPEGFSTYQWYKNDLAIIGATNNNYVVKEPGTYSLKITLNSGASYTFSPELILNRASQQNMNFVQTIIYKAARKQGELVSTIGEVSEQFSYYDGLGRPLQTLQTQASPNRRDMIKPVEYDDLGRVNKEYLPYIANQNDGLFDETALRTASGNYESSSQNRFYDISNLNTASTAYPYSEVSYEPSPLNRPVAQYAAGDVWAKDGDNRPVTTAYLINNSTDSVLNFNINSTASLMINNIYTNAVFNKLLATDENGNRSATFTDSFGKTVLKRNYLSDTDCADTYYVYDTRDNLSFVLPPEAIEQLSTTSGIFPTNLLTQFAFQYRYDGRNRMIWKKVPGAEPVVMLYDDRDRLVLSQDGEQKNNNIFSFTKYDALNRPIMTGVKEIIPSTTWEAKIADLRNKLSGTEWSQGFAPYETLDGSKFGYTSNSLPKTLASDQIYTVIYYDDYDFRAAAEMDATVYDYEANGVLNEFSQTNRVKGQVTGSLTRILETNEMLGSINYYDERYRLIQNISEQHKDRITISNNGYDFVGNLLQTKTQYVSPSANNIINENFIYDHADRLLTVTHQIDQQDTVLMVSNEYNELGQLIRKNLHKDSPDSGGAGGAGDFIQSVDYRYNIRGWLTRINQANLSPDGAERPDLFGMEMGYTDNLGLSGAPQHNGNIAAIKWASKRNLPDDMSSPTKQSGYGYGYDPLNRITNANFFEGSTYTSNSKYQLNIPEYDLNGNIKQLNRNDEAAANMDQLTYHYTGNQLDYVEDDSNNEAGFKDGNTGNDDYDYDYDDNGNMIKDLNKGITNIAYNYLNLPEKITFDNGDYINYVYDAAGTKLRQEVFKNGSLEKVTDYVGAMIFQNDTLQFIQTAEGRLVPRTVEHSNDFEYQYHLKDHLGNVRTTFAVRDDHFNTSFETRENPYFDNYGDITKLNAMSKSGSHSNRVSSAHAERMGISKTFLVSEGDRVNASVYAKYIAGTEDNALNGSALVNAFVAMMSGTTVGGETPFNATGLKNGFLPASASGGSDDNEPQAYLNYLLMDKSFNYLAAGFQQLSTNAADDINNLGTHELLSFEDITITQDGYLMIFVSNESETLTEVYFDDLMISHHKTEVIQADDYYPFGLTFNSYKREDNKVNKMNTFQDQEYDEETGWVQFKWRNHMPELGRFFNVDPLAEDYYYNSPYAFSENQVVAHVELEGLEKSSIHLKDRTAHYASDNINYTPPSGVLFNNVKPGKPLLNVSLNVSVGLQAGARLNKKGGEVNFGSKQVMSASTQDGLDVGVSNETKSNFAFDFGFAGMESSKTVSSSTETQEVELLAGTGVKEDREVMTTTTTFQGSTNLFGVYANSEKTETETKTEGFAGSTTSTSQPNTSTGYSGSGLLPIGKKNKLEIGLIIKLEIGVEINE